jgi:protein-ribulosamine 3-kinase
VESVADWNEIAEQIHHSTGEPFTASEHRGVGGGSINDAYVVSDGTQQYFVKLNRANRADMFEAEAAGLAEMAKSQSVRVPQPICLGVSGVNSYIVLEYLELGNGDSANALGQQLADMHRTTQERFGWDRNNTIGSTEQVNTWTDDWVEFYGRHRLLFQLGLPGAQHYGKQLIAAGEELVDNLGVFFETYRPLPSLLHGDLWGGNYATTRDGAPVIFDPAVYYGDREADIAMTELFGGFGRRFYDAYNEAWPLDPGYGVRKILYNLYHVLNHLNLFGGGYGGQAYSMIGRLQAEYR